ncbi:UbiA family prenyltransferase [Nakamurella flavida]|uniref:UbiA family prenyltransferase n=1 Tax=Nakamurella flavida TaxID=363630 RepID=A0A939C4B1_9ACTN|nr:UbiA family prenyltransferase [Nakamurella flavida]MBM9477916.1 UbiA family prenyltransferase [Nakamurella flavida]MDP9778369.1 4-hydroxybenzoate polyprenyltransferase [Nakamurella flavida]
MSSRPESVHPRSVVRALALSCHPVPTVAVTAVGTGLAVLAGLSAGRVALVGLAVLAGQLSIGWSNDRIDAARDAAVARADKPVAAGALPLRQVEIAAGAAVLVCVAVSLLLGPPAAVASLLVVVCGWAYNLGLKASVLSFLPYAVAFGTLPAVATLARPDRVLPAGWAMVAGALFGVAAHLANVLPDLAADRATGVRGFPHVLGARICAVLAPALLFVSSAVVLFGAGRTAGWAWAAAAVLAGVAVAGAIAGYRRPTSPWLFRCLIVVVLADVALFAVSGGSLV